MRIQERDQGAGLEQGIKVCLTEKVQETKSLGRRCNFKALEASSHSSYLAQ